MTILGAGIQINSERSQLPTCESFRWPNRERLYQALRANQVENVVMISGDVHFA